MMKQAREPFRWFGFLVGVGVVALGYATWFLAAMALMGEGSKAPKDQETGVFAAFLGLSIVLTIAAFCIAIMRLRRRSKLKILDIVLLAACLPLLYPVILLAGAIYTNARN